MAISSSVMNLMQETFPYSTMTYWLQVIGYPIPNLSINPRFNTLLNKRPVLPTLHIQPSADKLPLIFNNISGSSRNNLLMQSHGTISEATLPYKILRHEKFARSLDYFERKFYMVTFAKLMSTSPEIHRKNGMSFAVSAFFLQLTLMALSLEVDPLAKNEIDKTIGFQASHTETIDIIKGLFSSLPVSSLKLKFRYAAQLMLWPGNEVSSRFRSNVAAALQLGISKFNGTETTAQVATILNQKVESLSGGTIRDTFDEDDVSENVTAVLTTLFYFRAQWRSAPTVLNGTLLLRDVTNVTQRETRMIKLNDIMGYVDIKEWNAQALEIPYSTPGLSLVIIIPRNATLKQLIHDITTTSIMNIISRMRRMRITATLPLYTLRTTLLLPNKLQDMGVSRLFDVGNLKPGKPLRLSHMVQRIMFWVEAGRNAYKDDGLNWDEIPDMKILVDRPYIYYVRWRNLTLLNGNFVF